jgi:long-chain acyl-CoA synthetase
MSERTFQSLADLFLYRVDATPDAMAFRFRINDGWGSLTWRQVGERVRNIASGLLALGISAEQRCAILPTTRVEWILADLGIVCAGAATTTVYPSNTPGAVLRGASHRIRLSPSEPRTDHRSKRLEVRCASLERRTG